MVGLVEEEVDEIWGGKETHVAARVVNKPVSQSSAKAF